MNSKEADLCPSQFGKVELRLHCRGEETPDFRTSFLVLEVRSFAIHCFAYSVRNLICHDFEFVSSRLALSGMMIVKKIFAKEWHIS